MTTLQWLAGQKRTYRERIGIWTSTLGSLTVAALLVAAEPARADSNCQPFSGGGLLTSTGGLALQGQLDLLIGRNSFHPQMLVVGTGTAATEDGRLVGFSGVTYDFGDGNVLVLGNNRSILSPIDENVWDVSEHGRVTDGTGRFLRATGRLVVRGTLTLAEGVTTADLTIEGRICNARADEDPA